MPVRAKALTLVAVGATVALAACASLQPRITRVHASRGPATGERPGGRAAPVDTGVPVPEPRGTGDDVGSAFPVANDEVRRVCRAAGWPRGWIPTAYVEAPGECPARDDVYNAAVIARYDRRPAASVMEVCADQVTPAGWVDQGDASVAAAERCPGAGKDGAGAAKRIRKVQR